MKACFKCDRWLPLSEFYKHPQMGDGHLGKCKACTRVDVRANRDKRRDYYIEYDRQRSKDPERVANIRVSQVMWPERYRARVHLHNAVTRGKIMKPKDCQECGASGRIHGHHTDYSKPLDVMWLCAKCHGLRHRTEAA